MADDAVILRVLRRIIDGDLAMPDDADVSAALAEVGDRIAANSRRVEHTRTLTLDPDVSRDDLAFYRGHLKSLHAERDALDAERDRLTAQRAEGGALAEFVALWHEHRNAGMIETGEPNALDLVFHIAARMLWDDFEIEKRREIVRGLFRVRLPLGGRGADRLVFTPLGAREAVSAA